MFTFQDAEEARAMDESMPAQLAEFELTDVVAQRDADTVFAFCSNGVDHRLFEFAPGLHECTVCGTVWDVLANPKVGA